MKVLLADVVKRPKHTALQDGEESLDGVGVNTPAILMPNVFLFAVANHVMRCYTLFEDEWLHGGIVGHHLRPSVKMFHDDRL